jgi:hypothetical protein
LVWGFWNSTFLIFQNFDSEPRYACFSIFLYPRSVSLFLHLSLCTFSQNKALGMLNPNLLKFLGYHNRFLRYLQKRVNFFNSAFYSARTFLNFSQLFGIPLAIKFEPDKIEMFCFLLLKADIHGFPAAIFVD